MLILFILISVMGSMYVIRNKKISDKTKTIMLIVFIGLLILSFIFS